MSGERPGWVDGDLVIDAAVMQQIEADAVACYPNEACGFAMGPDADAKVIDEMRSEPNEADKWHARDPITFPRTAKTYFKINELRASRLFEAQEKAGRPVKVIYHSHCDVGAYFSPEDAYTFAVDGQLTWPCAFVVVSVVEGVVVDRKLWVHTLGTNGFHESTINVR
jgi:proteasome lid subunit RPN8/RPN11